MVKVVFKFTSHNTTELLQLLAKITAAKFTNIAILKKCTPGKQGGTPQFKYSQQNVLQARFLINQTSSAVSPSEQNKNTCASRNSKHRCSHFRNKRQGLSEMQDKKTKVAEKRLFKEIGSPEDIQKE